MNGTFKTLGKDRHQLRVWLGRDATGKDRWQTKMFRGSARDARAAANKMAADLSARNAAPRFPGDTKLTVLQALEGYYDRIILSKPLSTKNRTRVSIDFYLAPLHRTRLDQLTPEKIAAFYARLQAHGGRCSCPNARLPEHRAQVCPHGGPLKASTVRRDHNVLYGALALAVKSGYIAANPADGCCPESSPEEKLASRITVPTDAEVRALMEEAARYFPGFVVYLDLAANLGSRRGELCGLRWPMVDLERSTVTFATALSMGLGQIQEKGTKADRTRTVALDPQGLALLRDHHAWCLQRALAAGVRLAPDAFVFSTADDGSTFWRPDNVTTRFSRLRARVDLQGVRLHDLRHYMCTTALDAGADLRTVQGRAGHSAITTTEKYLHVVPASDRAAAALLRGRLASG